MSSRTILIVAAAAAVAFVLGYRSGAAAGARPASGAIVGAGTDWLAWQAGD